jgi:hypothetical protein
MTQAELPLTDHQRDVAERVLAEESNKRRHLVVALSGAHAYGFPSPDSDLDLKCIHIDPTARVLGLRPLEAHADRLGFVDGVEIDYTSNELKPALVGILQGNGNYLERVLGPLQMITSPELEPLKPLARASLSRRLHRHYLGFATSQQKAWEASYPGTAKKVLYVLRTALTGAHALRSGEIVTDLRLLLDDYNLGDARDLIERKRAGERVDLDLAMAERCKALVQRAFEALDAAVNSSHLPDSPPNEADFEAFLLGVRIGMR